MLIPVILSGGSGTRLWPLSRELYPKQLLKLTGDKTLLQQTALRLASLPDAARPLVLCNEQHRFMAAEQLRRAGVEPEAIILEPEARNTAPAVAVAALYAEKAEPGSMILVAPADHVISGEEAFAGAVETAKAAAESGALALFGVTPDRAETGYGYIHKGEEVNSGDHEWFRVDEFVEKPDSDTARKFYDSGGYLFNCGIFLFKASVFLKELEAYAPDVLEGARQALEGAKEDLDFIRLATEPFSRCPGASIDYAVMEKTGRAAVVPLFTKWNDVGSWDSLMVEGEADLDGNVKVGDVVVQGVKDSYLRTSHRLLAAVDVENLVIVVTKDAVLVAPRDKVQNVKAVVTRLKEEGRDEAVSHPKVYRPWGAYETIDLEDRFQVKRITVKPGGVLSLQMHHHRAEHWVVVKGTARVTRGEDTMILQEDQSTYIPLGTTHRLENPGKIDLELIEVQTGSYLGEDDIVRMEDRYGRRDD